MSFDLFAHPDYAEHDHVLFARDPRAGLRAIIAIHDLARGPSLGGCRIWRYGDDSEALSDALRLSRGMTYKSALADLPLGGGKSVALLSEKQEKTPAMMRAMGRAVEALGGRYIVAEDVGATVADMDEIGAETAHVCGGSRGVGDPSPWTAEGVFLCLKAAAELRRDKGLEGARVAVKGLGSVGWKLAAMLHGAGARLIVADIREAAAAQAGRDFGAEIAPVARIHAAECDVFAPCALGGELNGDTIPQLNAGIVCGAANNQLSRAEDGARLAAGGVLYCPDYLVNAGGVIRIAQQSCGLSDDEARAKLIGLPDRLREIVARADAERRPTAEIADEIARERYRR